VSWGQSLTYTAVVSNLSSNAVPAGATIVETLPATLTGRDVDLYCRRWRDLPCRKPVPVRSITLPPRLFQREDRLPYTISATATGSGSASISNAFTVTAPGAGDRPAIRPTTLPRRRQRRCRIGHLDSQQNRARYGYGNDGAKRDQLRYCMCYGECAIPHGFGSGLVRLRSFRLDFSPAGRAAVVRARRPVVPSP